MNSVYIFSIIVFNICPFFCKIEHFVFVCVALLHVGHYVSVLHLFVPRPVASAVAAGASAPALKVAAPVPNLSPAPSVAPAVSVFCIGGRAHII